MRCNSSQPIGRKEECVVVWLILKGSIGLAFKDAALMGSAAVLENITKYVLILTVIVRFLSL